MVLDLYFGGLLVVVTLALLVTFALGARLVTPFRVLALLLITAVLTPFQHSSGLNACLLLASAVCSVELLRLLSRRGQGVLRLRAVTAVIAFMGVVVLAFIVGQYPWFPTAHASMRAQLGGLAIFLLSGGLLLAVAHQIESVRDLERLTWLFVWTGAAAVVTSVTYLPLRVGPIGVTDAESIGSLFWTWIVSITFSQALFNASQAPLKRLAVLLVGVGALARGLGPAFSWASGWLPPLVAAGLLLLARFPKLTIGAALLAVVPALAWGGGSVEVVATQESYSSMTRMQALWVVLDMIGRNPWLGFGPANYYEYTLLYPILGWWVRFNSHNNYIDLVAQTGVVGLVVFLWFAAELLRLGMGLAGRVAPGFSRAYVLGSVAGLCASLVSGLLADWIIPFAFNIGLQGFRSSLLFWFFLGGLLAMKRLAAQAPATIPVSPVSSATTVPTG